MTGLGNMDDVYKHYLKVIDENKQLDKKLDIAVNTLEWVEEQADTSTQYDYDPEVILKNIVRDCQEALAKIKELK